MKRNYLPETKTTLSLLDLSQDLITYSIPASAHPNKDYSSIETTHAMATLASTCKTMHKFFQPELYERRVQQLLTYILQYDEKSINVAIKIANEQPHLYFIPTTASDYATIENNLSVEENNKNQQRIFKNWSAYQAILGTHNNALLLKVKPSLDAYLGGIKDGFKMAAEQEKDKFPNGFDFPLCTDIFHRLIGQLEKAITDDQQLKENWNNPNQGTSKALKAFRSHYQLGIIETGLPFNMNDLISAHEIYNKNSHPMIWNKEKEAFFAIFVIGFLERLLTTFYLDVACTGLKYLHDVSFSLHNHFLIKDLEDCNQARVVPFSEEDSNFRLGENFFIDSFNGEVKEEDAPRLLSENIKAWKKYIEEIQKSLKFNSYMQTYMQKNNSFSLLK